VKTIQVKKGEILQHKGDLNTKGYMVKKGLLRSYSIDEKGKEHIFLFAPENWIIADSISGDLPCQLFIDVLENSEIQVFEKVIEDNSDTTKILLKRLSVIQNRVIMLMSATAIERYEHFVETYPEITQRVPQRMIASYLGITPEALSKVKGDRFKNKK